jgi:hypothetical protein
LTQHGSIPSFLFSCGGHMAAAACLDLHRFREKETRPVVARLSVRCLVTSQNDPKKGTALTLVKN